MWMKKLNYMYFKSEEFRNRYFRTLPTHEYSWIFDYQGQPMMGLHATMFATSINTFSNEEQRAEWMPKVQNYDILGTYAQTELGHGSNVAGLETTATFDKETDEFVLHTPTTTATKWWPGDLGRYANHAVVFAQLIIESDGHKNNYGVCPFIVQLRDLETHKHLSGIKSGDMGPKFGYLAKDNGWMQMTHVRIPRKQMLQRFITVDRSGDVSITGDIKILYSTMILIRTIIIANAKNALSQTLLVALRYSTVRRQFRNISG